MPELMIAHRTVLSARRSLTKTRELRNLRRARRRDQAVPHSRAFRFDRPEGHICVMRVGAAESDMVKFLRAVCLPWAKQMRELARLGRQGSRKLRRS
jgi:hypothetical protein